MVGISFVVLAVVVLGGLAKLPGKSRTLPEVCACAITFIGILLAVAAMVYDRMQAKARIEPKSSSLDTPPATSECVKSSVASLLKRDVVLISLVLVVTAIAIPLLGFYSSTCLCIIVVYLLYRNEYSRKAIMQGLLFGIAVTVAQFVLFGLIMRLPVPIGLLF